jgi:hypothetical protein
MSNDCSGTGGAPAGIVAVTHLNKETYRDYQHRHRRA